MIKNFFKWITYILDKVSVVDILPQIIALLLPIFVAFFVLFSTLTTNTILHNVLWAIAYTACITLAFLWGLYCKIWDASFLVYMFPTYPIMCIYIVKILLKRIHRRKERS